MCRAIFTCLLFSPCSSPVKDQALREERERFEKERCVAVSGSDCLMLSTDVVGGYLVLYMHMYMCIRVCIAMLVTLLLMCVAQA